MKKKDEEEKANDTKSEGIRVFVYGTLKQNHGNHPLLAENNATLLGRCYVEGRFRMLDLSAYPCVVRTSGAVNDPAPRIYGEVYRICQDTLNVLDILEGNGSFFTRSKVVTPWKNAWMYFLPESWAERHVPIETGMWRPNDEETEFWRGTTSNTVAG